MTKQTASGEGSSSTSGSHAAASNVTRSNNHPDHPGAASRNSGKSKGATATNQPKKQQPASTMMYGSSNKGMGRKQQPHHQNPYGKNRTTNDNNMFRVVHTDVVTGML